MVFENYPVDEALRERSGGIEVNNVHTVERDNYPLALTALPGQQMVLQLKNNTSRYEPASIARMLQHLMIVLGGMSAQPEPRIEDVPLLTITEEQQILFEWNETATEYPRELSLSELFEAQAARTPEAVALLFEDTALTYRELNERANQLARYLQRTGVGPEVLVGILMNRSMEMIVAVLGILKAGGAYVPLDPSYPLERLAFMVQDSGMRLLLTGERLSEIADDYAGATLSLNEQWDLMAGESVANVASSRASGEPGLCHLHLRLDGTAQGRDDSTALGSQSRDSGAALHLQGVWSRVAHRLERARWPSMRRSSRWCNYCTVIRSVFCRRKRVPMVGNSWFTSNAMGSMVWIALLHISNC